MAKIKKDTPTRNHGENMKNGGLASLQAKAQNGTAALECWIFLKIFSVELSHAPVVLLFIYPRGRETQTHRHTNVHSSFIHNSQKGETPAWLSNNISKMAWPYERKFP